MTSILVDFGNYMKHHTMYVWLDMIAAEQGRIIFHRLNHGNEKRVGPYLADGYNPDTVTPGELFGMVECDIGVPDVGLWPQGQERDMTPYAYFSEILHK